MFECFNCNDKNKVYIDYCKKCNMAEAMSEDEILNNVFNFFKCGKFLTSSESGIYLWDNYDDIKDKIGNKDLYIYSLILCKKDIAFILKGVYKDNAIGYFISKSEVSIDECGLRYW